MFMYYMLFMTAANDVIDQTREKNAKKIKTGKKRTKNKQINNFAHRIRIYHYGMVLWRSVHE